MNTIRLKNTFSDLAVGVTACREAHAARKRGATGIRIQPVKTIPCVHVGYWSWALESLLVYPAGVKEAVNAVFHSFDENTQHMLAFGPEDGKWPDRIRFWQRALKPQLTPKQYSAAILTMLAWAIECTQRRLAHNRQ